jgi:hypothetical protein
MQQAQKKQKCDSHLNMTALDSAITQSKKLVGVNELRVHNVMESYEIEDKMLGEGG